MDSLNNLRNSDNNISIALENPKTRDWFEHIVALLRTLSLDEGVTSAEDLKQHVITIQQAISGGRRNKMSKAASDRIDVLFHQVFSPEEPLDHLNKAKNLFESGDFRRLIPLNVDAKKGITAFDKAFIKKWIVPKMFQEYPNVEEFGCVDEVKNWVVNALVSTTSNFELKRMKDRVDGIPWKFPIIK